MPLPSGTVTFLFTDIEGSTKLWEEHPEPMHLALARHDLLMRQAIEEHSGHVFKTIGDAFCAAFHTAPEALQAALIAQQALTSEPFSEGVTIKVRMALHTGVAEVRDNDYFGQPLNRVARLLAAGHGGQVLLSLPTAELARDALPAGVVLLSLGEHGLRDLNRPETVFQLLHPDLPTDFALLKSLDHLPNNLPLQLTSFIGREREIGEIKNLLTKTRLLTLTGSGGCGKTRLSLQVAADVLDHYPDGVWLVELASLADPALVPQTAASLLRLTEQPGKPFVQTLTEYLKSKRLLLALDNCEHLLSACAQLCNTLLRACPHLTILATSREGLGIAGEQTYRVPSLTIPDPKQTLTIEQLSQYEAVRLFIERAVSSKADFTLTNVSAPALAAVCHRLDGIPLAIELAAARVRLLSVEEINSRLDNRFRLLTGGSKTALPRQQTLRALIDWSYDLLNPQEKRLLCLLSVFTGGWTLAAAERVCAGESADGAAIEDWDVLDLLTSLVDKSLVIAETQGGGTRYRLLETVRHYGRELLLGSEAARRRHRDYFLVWAEEAAPKLRGVEQAHWSEALETEHDNLRQALGVCREEPEGGEAVLRFGAALWSYWATRGHLSEGRAHLAAALGWDTGPEQRLARAHALLGAGNIAFRQGDYAAARSQFEESLTLFRESADMWGTAFCLKDLGHVASRQGDYATARTLYEESLTSSRDRGDKRGIADALNGLGSVVFCQGENAVARALLEESLTYSREEGNKQSIAYALLNLGNVACNQGEYGAAHSLYEESLTIYRELGVKYGIALSLNGLGSLALNQGDCVAARVLHEESLAISRDVGEKRGIANALINMGQVALNQSDFGVARALNEESLTIFRELGEKRGIANSLLNLGDVALNQDDAVAARILHEESLTIFQELGIKSGIAKCLDAFAELAHQEQQERHATQLMGAAMALREVIGTPRPPIDQEQFDREVAEARSALGEAAFMAAWAEGRAMTWEQAVEYAMERK